jgi:gentisate 1,2-dioxygenase
MDLIREARAKQLLPFWTVRSQMETVEPRSPAVPHLWKWKDVEPLIRKSAEVVSIEEAERRAFLLMNPGLGENPNFIRRLLGAFQLVKAGESAACHRHTPAASRFIIEGSGGFTTLDGEKCRMARGDLIITPNFVWHDHGNEADSGYVIWFDVLDVGLVDFFDSRFDDFSFKDPISGSPTVQTVTKPENGSTNLYAAGGIVPRLSRTPPRRHSPQLIYKWEHVRAALEQLKSHEGDPYDGLIVEYTDPTTGGPALPTMAFHLQLFRPRQRTLAHRHTAATAYFVVEGRGSTHFDDVTLEWSPNDVFVVPSWRWHEHANEDDGDAILYSVTDAPVLRRLGLYREEGRTARGEVELIEV